MDRVTREAVREIVSEGNARCRASREGLERAAKVRGVGSKVGRTGRHVMAVDQANLMRVVAKEGKEVLSEAADGYWNDMKRRFPFLSDGHDVKARFSPGCFSSVFRDGKWFKRVGRGKWVEVAAPRRDWSAEGAPLISDEC